MIKHLALVAALAGPMVPAAAAQDQSRADTRNPTNACGIPVQPPAVAAAGQLALPSSGRSCRASRAQGNVTLIEPQTYLYYIQLQQRRSRPSEGVWVTYDDSVEQIDARGLHAPVEHQLPRQPFDRDSGLHLLERRDRQDRPLQHGGAAAGQDRRLTGSKKFEDTKIDEKLKELGAEIRLDTFIDRGPPEEVEGIIRDMMKEKGFQFAEVRPRDRGAVGRAEAGQR